MLQENEVHSTFIIIIIITCKLLKAEALEPSSFQGNEVIW